MPTFGVTPSGFLRPSLQDLLALIEADQRAEISQSLDLSSDSVLGQNNAIYARQLGLAWEALEAVHDGNDPDRAEGDAATSLAKITGTDREGASRSEVDVTVTLAIGTTLLAGINFAHVHDKPDVRFTPKADFTAPGPAATQDYILRFQSENTGRVLAPGHSLIVIATPVVGWSFVTNEFDASPGSDADDDARLRVNRERALARSGSSGVDQIRADVIAVPGVSSAEVFENYTDDTDSQGLPPKSFMVVLFDDAGADDTAIAQAIWDSKPGGIEAVGDSFGTATDNNGGPHSVWFSRALEIPIYIALTVEPRAGYVGDEDFKANVAANLNTAMGTGQDLSEWDITEAAAGLGAKVTNIAFGPAPGPVDDADIIIGNTSIVRFNSLNITFI